MKIAVLAALMFAQSLALAQSSESGRPADLQTPAVAPIVSDLNLSTAEITVAPTVHVESVERGGQAFEIVYLPNNETVEIPVDLSAAQGLTAEEQAQAREDAREMLELTTNMVLSDEFNGTMVLGEDGQATVLEAVDPDGSKAKRTNWFKRAFAINPEMYKPMPKGLPFPQKFKRFLQMSWQFVFVETIHAGINYYKGLRAAPEFKEYGISVDLKIEPQIFIGKFNPTGKVKALRRSYGVALELGFNKAAKRVFIRTRVRRERGSGGLGLPAVKAEFKLFQTDGTHLAQGGQSWYPVSPPVASFVFDRDHSGHYFAQGITFGFNTGDLIPGSTLTNTFAQYQQSEDIFRLEAIPQKAQEALKTAARTVLPRRPMMCSDLFAAAH